MRTALESVVQVTETGVAFCAMQLSLVKEVRKAVAIAEDNTVAEAEAEYNIDTIGMD
jgi:hypothetical protein